MMLFKVLMATRFYFGKAILWLIEPAFNQTIQPIIKDIDETRNLFRDA
jgi:hypothetical protein